MKKNPAKEVEETEKLMVIEFKGLYDNKQFDNALDVCLLWLCKFPKDHIALYNAGRCYQNLEKQEEALAMFSAAKEYAVEKMQQTNAGSEETLRVFCTKVELRLEQCAPIPRSNVSKIGLFGFTCGDLTKAALNAAAITGLAYLGYSLSQ